MFQSFAGNYTCKAANTKPSTVLVYVSDGKPIYSYKSSLKFYALNLGLNLVSYALLDAKIYLHRNDFITWLKRETAKGDLYICGLRLHEWCIN